MFKELTYIAVQDILTPTVSMVDNETGVSLCTYELEEQPHELRQEFTSVVMCRIYRCIGCDPCFCICLLACMLSCMLLMIMCSARQ